MGLLAVVLIISCAVKPAPELNWNFEPEGIQIHFEADSLLNIYDGKAHTLILEIYQLSVNDVFQDLAKNASGLQELLAGERFDRSVIGVDHVIVQPGAKNTKIIDRYENTKWVGIVAGYYNLISGKVNLAFEVPVSSKVKGLIRRKEVKTIEPLIINLNLGTQTLHKIGDN